MSQYRYKCFWSESIEPQSGLGETVDLSYLSPLLSALGFAGAALGIIGEAIVQDLLNLELAAINAEFESAATIAFWSV